MISDDLSALFTPPARGMLQQFGIILGNVVTFNQADGTNQISINGALIPNVPVLATGAEVNINTGDTVVCGQIGNGFVILGRIAIPGSATYASASTQTLVNEAVLNHPFTIPFPGVGVYSNLLSCQITVPVWAQYVSILGILEGNMQIPSGNQLASYLQLDGSFGTIQTGKNAIGPYAANSPSTVGTASNGVIRKVGCTPGEKITLSGWFACGSSFSSITNNNLTIDMSCTFTRNA
jgi:hypothetical protein